MGERKTTGNVFAILKIPSIRLNWSGGRHWAGMCDVGVRDRTKLIGFNGRDGDRLAAQREELDFVRLPAGVDMHYRADIAGLQPLGRYVFREYNSGMLIQHFASPKS